ncbi:hypothetical protein [Mycobacteroides abscessus]|uniref:hypothetical protein n=1 Tax=Mycobacteroides abscessus TaxID=36809 RepID=UPI0012FFF94B|nr:hypothetical protein [Mycobacteroides abscessus]
MGFDRGPSPHDIYGGVVGAVFASANLASIPPLLALWAAHLTSWRDEATGVCASHSGLR